MKKRMIPCVRQAQTLGLALALLLLQVSCGQGQSSPGVLSRATSIQKCNPDLIPPSRSTFTIQDGPITQIATEVGNGVGKVIASGQGSTNRTIFIFEEKHDSRIGQMEIALMLWRLQKSSALRQISLEGAFVANGDLSAKWFHDSTGSAAVKRARQETALSLLREGEINAAEFIALLLPAVQVRGNETESEYNVTPSKTNSTLSYLVGIAQRSLTSSDARRVDDLVKAKKIDEALDTIFSKDDWSRGRFQKLYGDNVASTEESVVIMREVETKARELGVRIEPQQEAGFSEDLNFYQMASRRSCTIVRNTLAMMDATSTAPVALLIGAAHTPKVVELIKAAKITYVVLAPLALVTPNKASKLTAPMYHRKMDLKSIDEAGMLGALLDGRKKPPSVLGKQWLKSKAAIYASVDLIAAAAARNERIPSDKLRMELQSFEPIKIDWSSMKVTREGDRARVMFKVTAQTSDINPRQTADIWVTGWHQPPLPPPPDGPPSVTSSSDDDFDMEKLVQAALDEDRNKIGEPAAQPGKVAVVQLSTKTMAAFSTDPTLLQQVTVTR